MCKVLWTFVLKRGKFQQHQGFQRVFKSGQTRAESGCLIAQPLFKKLHLFKKLQLKKCNSCTALTEHVASRGTNFKDMGVFSDFFEAFELERKMGCKRAPLFLKKLFTQRQQKTERVF